MPFGDGTGPTGLGPGSGRGAGFCGGLNAPGSLNRGAGFGRGGQGRRNRFRMTGPASWWRRWGWRRAFVPYGAAEISSTKPEEELATLKSQEEWLQSTLSQVRQKIEELEAKPRQE